MKTEEDIKNRIVELKSKISINNTILRGDDNLTNGEAEDLDFDNYELNQRIKILEWVLN